MNKNTLYSIITGESVYIKQLMPPNINPSTSYGYLKHLLNDYEYIGKLIIPMKYSFTEVYYE